MGGKLVSDLPSSNDEGGGSGERTAPLLAYTEIFDNLFPYYLSIGMTYDQYWNDDCELVRYYRKASRIKRDLKNQDLWLQGLYIYEALIDAAPIYNSIKPSKPKPYAEKPYDLFEDKSEKKAEDKPENKAARTYLEAFMTNVNQKFKNDSKGGGVNG